MDHLISSDGITGLSTSIFVISLFVHALGVIAEAIRTTVTGVQQAQMTTLAIRAHRVKAALFGKDKWVGMTKDQVRKLPSKPIKIVRMSKKLYMVKTKYVSNTSSVYDLALSMMWGLEIDSTTRSGSGKIETCDVFEVNANLKHLEETHDEVDWLLLDTGSTVHICRDRSKMHNRTRRTTRIRGVNGDKSRKVNG